jgi:hypothetical protein
MFTVRRTVLALAIACASPALLQVALAQPPKSTPARPPQMDAEATGGIALATVLGLVCLAFCLFLFVLSPVVVAALRDHPDFVSILLLQLFLGWCFPVWVVCLVWAFKSFPKRQHG